MSYKGFLHFDFYCTELFPFSTKSKITRVNNELIFPSESLMEGALGLKGRAGLLEDVESA